jgi:tetratricopeptide (TPR) repeat protein
MCPKVLAGCSRDEDEQGSEALTLAELAVEAADQTARAELQCRAHSNLGLFLFERGELTAAMPHFVAALRAALQAGDLHLQAITKYHLGVAISHTDVRDVNPVGNDALVPPEGDLVANVKSETSPAESNADEVASSDPTSADDSEKHPTLPAASLSDSAMTPARTPKDWFLQSESLAGSLVKPDDRLGVLAHGCRGEEEYYSGEFHTAEAEFTIALKRLKELLGESTASTSSNDGSNDEYDATEPIDILAVRELDPELAKLQGFLLSYLGCTLLVEGRFELAERSHQNDLALALEREDVYAQQRALRNLAMVFNCTQRYEKAIPLWRDALEIAAVLQSKPDQMMALSGLGTALKECQVLRRASSLPASPADPESEEYPSLRAPPLPVFLRQRALAVEVGDRHQQILAQRHIVSVYESHTNDSEGLKPESAAGESAVEKRLAECDIMVRLCEQYENLQYRADAYRSLANALTAQLARLRSRGAARFADAISVLSQKRDAVCNKYQEAAEALALATAVIFHSEADVVPFELKERQQRPPVTRIDAFPRR